MQAEPTEGQVPEHRRMIAVKGHPGIYRKGSRYRAAADQPDRQAREPTGPEKVCNGIPDSMEENLALLDELGGPRNYNH